MKSIFLLTLPILVIQNGVSFMIETNPQQQRRQQQQQHQTGSKSQIVQRIPSVNTGRRCLYMTLYNQIVSPFDESSSSSSSGSSATTTKTAGSSKLPADIVLDLTLENVELVLDEMRPFLVQDGGNVVVKEIDGPVVKLELQGNCGTCPSSTQTMKMGLERGLKEKIPEIQEVIQALPEGPALCEDEINIVLNGVRPFLQIAGGSIDIDRLEGIGGLQPTIWLHMQGSSASLNSVKLEIAQRLQRHFMLAGMQIQWV